jgi:hypothetical protein
MMKYRDNQWAGYSYAWRADGTDAHLVPEGGEMLMEGSARLWSYPTRGNCLGCHNQDRALGLEVDQLDFDADPAGNVRPTSTLSRWRAGRPGGGRRPHHPRLPRVDGKAPLERAARAYLHRQLLHLPRPRRPTPRSIMGLRFVLATSLAGPSCAAPTPEEGRIWAWPAPGRLGTRRSRPLAPGPAQCAPTAATTCRPSAPSWSTTRGWPSSRAWIRPCLQCP